MEQDKEKQVVYATKDFRLVQLNISGICDIVPLNGSVEDESCKAETNFTPERFKEIMDYCKNNWKIKKIVSVKHTGMNDKGLPLNPVIVGFREESKQQSDFRLVGLARNGEFTMELIDTDRESFHAMSNMSKETFFKLFNYCEQNWEDRKIATVEHEGLNPSGTPINPLVIEVREWDTKADDLLNEVLASKGLKKKRKR